MTPLNSQGDDFLRMMGPFRGPAVVVVYDDSLPDLSPIVDWITQLDAPLVGISEETFIVDDLYELIKAYQHLQPRYRVDVIPGGPVICAAHTPGGLIDTRTLALNITQHLTCINQYHKYRCGMQGVSHDRSPPVYLLGLGDDAIKRDVGVLSMRWQGYGSPTLGQIETLMQRGRDRLVNPILMPYIDLG